MINDRILGWTQRAVRLLWAAVVLLPVLSTIAAGVAPTITSVQPQPVDLSGSTAQVTIGGTGLAPVCAVPGTTMFLPPVVYFGAIDVSTYIQGDGANFISLAIPSSVLASYAGTTITVDASVYSFIQNPGFQGCASVNSNSFSVQIGSNVTPPVLTSIVPTSATSCSPAFSLSLFGSNFQPGSAGVLGTDLTSASDYTFLTSTALTTSQLTVTVPASAIPVVTTATTLSVWGGNPSPPSANPPANSTYLPSSPQSFTVNPAPVLQSISPTSLTAGSGAFVLSTTIANYIRGVTKVEWGPGTSPPVPLAVVAETAQPSGVYLVTWTVPASLIPTPAAGSTATMQVNVVNQDAANPNGTPYAVTCSALKTVIVVNAVPLQITTAAPLQEGEVGVAYSQAFTAIGGTSPYTWTMSPAVAGLTLNPTSGVLSGTPTTTAVGSITIQVSVADSAEGKQTSRFPLAIDAPLSVTPTLLPAGTVNLPYSQTLTVAGGKAPYKWIVGTGSAAPDGLTLSAGGVLSGTPTKAASYAFAILVTDALNGFTGPQLTLTINAPPQGLTITTATIPGGTLSAAYSQRLVATGGSPGYTWSVPAGQLPAGIQLDSSGLLSGTPTAVGSFPFTATVTDTAKATKSQSYSLTVGLPAAPPVTIQPSQTQSSSLTDQPTVSMTLGSGYPVNLTGTFTLTFTPSAAGLPASYTPPDLQFASGGLTATANIAANTTTINLPPSQGIQLGSVAGTVTVALTALTASLPGGGTQTVALPNPAPSTSITVQAQKPVITGSVALNNKAASGFTLEVTHAVSNTRDLVSATLTFHAAAGATLTGTTSFTVPLNTGATPLSTAWFTSAAGRAAGGAFDLQIPFNYSGDPTAIGTVDVVLTNAAGASTTVSGK